METQSTFSFAIFQNKFTRWHIKLSVYQCKNKSTSHIQYLFGHLFSRNAKKTHADQMIVQVFLALSEKKHPSKEEVAKNFFPSVYVIGTACFDECFFIPYDNWKTLFFTQIYHYPKDFCKHCVAAFFEVSVLKEVRILCWLSPH